MLTVISSLIGLIISLIFFAEWSLYFCGFVGLGALIGMMGYFEGWFHYYFSVGVSFDLLSWRLVYLTFWITGLMFLASLLVFNIKKFSREFIITISLLGIFLMMVFVVNDLISLYIFFEASLIPTFFLISGWGYQPERLKAGLYLFFYTIFGSLPLLLGILYLKGTLNTLRFHLFPGSRIFSLVLCLVIIGAFLIKIPMFLVHLWLPKAHVEAPVSGSIILAGVLLKLGGYGLLRIMVLFSSVFIVVGKILLILSLVGGILISLLCLRQFDLKALIAYSSVVHMGLALAGIIVVRMWGHQGALALMIGHGLCSSGLFAGANVMYERGGTRRILMNRGAINLFPRLILWWFVLCVCNMAAPPRLNLLGEISLIVSLVRWSTNVCLLLAGVSFFSAGYSIYLFSLVCHGKPVKSFGFFDVKAREFLLLVMHWYPLNVFILRSDLVFSWLWKDSLLRIITCGVIGVFLYLFRIIYVKLEAIG